MRPLERVHIFGAMPRQVSWCIYDNTAAFAAKNDALATKSLVQTHCRESPSCGWQSDRPSAARPLCQVRGPPVWLCWPLGCEMPATALPARLDPSVTAMLPGEMMLTSRLSRVSTGRRRTWMSDMLRAAASVSSSPKAILHVLAQRFPDWRVRAIKSGCVRKFSR